MRVRSAVRLRVETADDPVLREAGEGGLWGPSPSTAAVALAVAVVAAMAVAVAEEVAEAGARTLDAGAARRWP